jgi:hypothetical protein
LVGDLKGKKIQKIYKSFYWPYLLVENLQEIIRKKMLVIDLPKIKNSKGPLGSYIKNKIEKQKNKFNT